MSGLPSDVTLTTVEFGTDAHVIANGSYPTYPATPTQWTNWDQALTLADNGSKTS